MLVITASVAAKLKDSLTAVILRAIRTTWRRRSDAARPHHAPCTRHSIATATVHATAPRPHALSTSLTTSLVHFYYCACFYYHDYCRYCTQYRATARSSAWWRMYKPPPGCDPSQNLGDLANAGEMVKIG